MEDSSAEEEEDVAPATRISSKNKTNTPKISSMRQQSKRLSGTPRISPFRRNSKRQENTRPNCESDFVYINDLPKVTGKLEDLVPGENGCLVILK